MAIAAIEHIEIDERGIARVAGSKIKVSNLVESRLGLGCDVEGVQAAFPHLTLSQVYAAFSYYYDHRAEIDAEIESAHHLVDRLKSEAGESPIAKRLHQARLQP